MIAITRSKPCDGPQRTILHSIRINPRSAAKHGTTIGNIPRKPLSRIGETSLNFMHGEILTHSSIRHYATIAKSLAERAFKYDIRFLKPLWQIALLIHTIGDYVTRVPKVACWQSARCMNTRLHRPRLFRSLCVRQPCLNVKHERQGYHHGKSVHVATTDKSRRRQWRSHQLFPFERCVKQTSSPALPFGELVSTSVCAHYISAFVSAGGMQSTLLWLALFVSLCCHPVWGTLPPRFSPDATNALCCPVGWCPILLDSVVKQLYWSNAALNAPSCPYNLFWRTFEKCYKHVSEKPNNLYF